MITEDRVKEITLAVMAEKVQAQAKTIGEMCNQVSGLMDQVHARENDIIELQKELKKLRDIPQVAEGRK